MVNTKIIADLPIELGIKRTYKGYFFLIAALESALGSDGGLCKVEGFMESARYME